MDDCKLNNLEVHSYHSFAYKFYKYCTTDTELKSIVNEALTPKIRYAFDLIVLDEAQDITPLLFELICKIFRDNENSSKNLESCIENIGNQRHVVGPQLCILGDKFQTIFEYNEADRRYITFAKELYHFNNIEWRDCSLSVSFRLTKNMAKFINKCLIHSDRIKAIKVTNTKPIYMICDCFMYSDNIIFGKLIFAWRYYGSCAVAKEQDVSGKAAGEYVEAADRYPGACFTG